jgi:GxxExxY protein
MVSESMISRWDAESQRMDSMNENAIGTIVIEEAIQVHREPGPGLLETFHEVILAYCLKARWLDVARQVPIKIRYRNITFDEGFHADLVVENKVLIELKSVEAMISAHKKQVQTSLRLTGLKLGYLLNFGEAVLKSGITRCVNGLDAPPPRPCTSAGNF